MKVKKLLVLALCMALVASISVVATLAYFTDNDSVTNTFTVGKVEIMMYETDTDTDTNSEDNKTIDGVQRDQANEYHLLPGQTYDKDPIVYVEEDSDDCFVYVKVENGLYDIQKAAVVLVPGAEGQTVEQELTVEEQLAAYGWTALKDVANVYYREHAKSDDQAKYNVFTKFAIADDAHNKAPEENEIDLKYLADYEEAEIKVTAYAIQKAGFDDEKIAWEKGNFQ